MNTDRCFLSSGFAAPRGIYLADAILHLTNTNGRTIVKSMAKGEITKQIILEAGLGMASQLGLE